jgi:hypothetical protein
MANVFSFISLTLFLSVSFDQTFLSKRKVWLHFSLTLFSHQISCRNNISARLENA